MRAQFYTLSNATKRKQEFLDDCKVFLDALEEREAESYLGVEDSFYPVDVNIVQSLLVEDRCLDGVIVDLIMNGNCVSKRLSITKLLDELTSLGSDYFNYFKAKYDVKDISKIEKIVSEKAGKLSRFNINQILKKLKLNPTIRSLR